MSMKLRNLDFGNFVFGQSGVQGFFGEPDEHRHHKWCALFFPGFSFANMVFVAKTITLKPRIYPDSSNTELRDGYKVKRFLPKSIWISPRSFFKGYLLNAVGLANPGAFAMFSLSKWQERKAPFQLSFMPVALTVEEKIVEAEEFCKILLVNLPLSKIFYYALQVNFSCPNTGHDEKQDPSDIIAILSVFRRLIPDLILIPKLNLLFEPNTVIAIKPYCDAFCFTNTLEFGKKESRKWWKKLFPKEKSPLRKHFGGRFSGGLSGAPLFPVLVSWLENMERLDDSIIIIAGGGIMRKKDILRLSKFKIVHGVALGSVATIRPWRLQSLIRYGNGVFKRRIIEN
jgi:dihydroorotate dehydrogenase